MIPFSPPCIDTTDVQNVTAKPIGSDTMIASIKVQCDFITGSNAKGCMVVLVGEFGNITANLEHNGSEVLNISHPLSCYHEIFAYDIESDGSVGTLAVPRVIILSNDGVTAACLSTTTTATNTTG